MKLREVVSQKKAPCEKCPYALGLIKTVTNPCPQCKRNDYDSYERFLNLPLQGKSYKKLQEGTDHV